ncbi:THO complex subunit 4A [Zalerion maritima]|uniref:THO complex subunit 4A n=1 Tax=Zalerion maritima TaxID=339359 RepID=A0AAD5RWT3_9PEZI|nr:THO complex subunit 4A [Zalerion maritima]
MDRSLDEILAEKKVRPLPSLPDLLEATTAGAAVAAAATAEAVVSVTTISPEMADWVHDKFEDSAPRRSNNRHQRESPETRSEPQGAKLRVDNVHYELTENDLEELFNRIGRVSKVDLKYDRAGRSEGTAFVIYESRDDAREAIRQFDGANANGQPIRLTLIPSGPSSRPQRNPFDTAVMPGRSLEERITRPRSVSPNRDIDEAARKGIDRYVPGGKRSSRSPANPPRRREGRRPGARRDGPSRSGNDSSEGGRGGGAGGSAGGTGGRRGNLRPKKTAEELDAEMADYFGSGGGGGDSKPTDAASGALQGDVDMIE